MKQLHHTFAEDSEHSVIRLEDGRIYYTHANKFTDEIKFSGLYANEADYMANCPVSNLWPI